MVTKAQIQSLNISENTCLVHIPLLDSASGGDEAVFTATFAITPGIYYSYVAGDIVWVAFEAEQMNRPVVIGKLYTGPSIGNSNITCGAITVTENASLPVTTKLVSPKTDDIVAVKDTYQDFKSVADIIDAIRKLKNESSSIDQKATIYYTEI